MSKVIKDPIYGYVEIDKKLMSDIVDTDCFQRLRNIVQTSYSPLYHSSVHNRFTHSLGVYYLGKKAISSKYIGLKGINNEDEIRETFLLACLLHDVGHAPFSHTGEDFFLNSIDDETSTPKIYKDFLDIVKNDSFAKDVEYYHVSKSTAKPHEIMSVIVAINNYSKHIDTDFKRDFFARCVTGYKYRDKNKTNSFLNCFIELLNSSVIDVDKLDYIIRDAFSTGFQSVSLDYIRLLEAVCIIESGQEWKLAYHKSALSVIENVVYAHDAERKWIQNHPIILYENFLIQHALKKTEKYFSSKNPENKLFSYNSLSSNGNLFNGNDKIRLLADEDIVYTIKNICIDELTTEYFSRDLRRHPIWKSESEYRSLLEDDIGNGKLDVLEDAFIQIEKQLNKQELPIINTDFINFCDEELSKLRASNEVGTDDDDTLQKGLESMKKWANCLRVFADENNLPFEFVIISTNKFKSGFLKEDIENLLIYFPNFNKSSKLGSIASLLKANKSREKFFYVYYKKGEKDIEIKKFSNAIQTALIG